MGERPRTRGRPTDRLGPLAQAGARGGDGTELAGGPEGPGGGGEEGRAGWPGWSRARICSGGRGERTARSVLRGGTRPLSMRSPFSLRPSPSPRGERDPRHPAGTAGIPGRPQVPAVLAFPSARVLDFRPGTPALPRGPRVHRRGGQERTLTGPGRSPSCPQLSPLGSEGVGRRATVLFGVWNRCLHLVTRQAAATGEGVPSLSPSHR